MRTATNGAIYALQTSGSTLYIGGWFGHIGGIRRSGLAAVNTETGAVTSWNPDVGGSVSAFAFDWPTLYIGGYFSSVGSEPRSSIAAVDIGSGAPTSFIGGTDDWGSVRGIALDGHTLYVGGSFSSLGGRERRNLASLDTIYGTATSWQPLSGSIYGMMMDEHSVYAGGSYITYSQRPESGANGFALYTRAPMNRIPPAISGTPTVGNTLSTSNGTWDGDVRNYAYQWRRDGEPIGGATSQSYALAAADSGRAISVSVTASTLSASARADSDPVSVGSAPVNTSPPRISGAPTVGRTLTAARGSWAGARPMQYAFEWHRCETEAVCEAIEGAAEHRYTLTDDDLGAMVRVVVTAQNEAGETSASSALTGAVAPSRSSTEGPLADALPSESPVGPVAGTDPFRRPEWSSAPAVEQPDVTRKPFFVSYFEPDGGRFAPHGDPDHYVATATGDGLLFAASQRNNLVYAFDSVTRAERYRFSAPGVRGIAYADGELFAVERPEEQGAEIGVYEATSGAPKRRFATPLTAIEGILRGDPERGATKLAEDATGVDLDEARQAADDEYRELRQWLKDNTGVDADEIDWWVSELVRSAEGFGDELAWWIEQWTGIDPDTLDQWLIQYLKDNWGIDAGGAVEPARESAEQAEQRAKELGSVTGVSVTSGEAWLTFTGGVGGGGIMVLDAQTGILKAIGWHFGRYDCSLSESEYGFDYERCLRDASAKSGLAEPEWWDIAADSELQGAFAGCRFTNRETLLAALAVSDIYVGDATLSSDCAAGRYRDPNGVAREASGPIDGMEAVPGMGWVMTLAPDKSGLTGSYVREYDAGSSLASIGAAELNLARSWAPRDANSNNHRDVSYLNREARLDWWGDLTETPWQRRNRCVSYAVSDADIFIVGYRGEHWYELARDFEKLEVKLDGQLKATLTSPAGQWCTDLNTIPSGLHQLTLTATVAGKQLSNTNAKLRVDHDNPRGTVDYERRYDGPFVRGTADVFGTLEDDHAGPRDWAPRISPAGLGEFTSPTSCGDRIAEPQPATDRYGCSWDTTTISDGKYDLKAELRDKLQGLPGEPNKGGPNTTDSSATSAIVDNNQPSLQVSGWLREGDDLAPLFPGEPAPLHIEAQDNPGSGVKSVEILVDAIRRDYAEQSCPQGACSMVRDFTFHPEQYTDGWHLVEVITTDGVGFTRSESWMVDVERDDLYPDDEESDNADFAGASMGQATAGVGSALTSLGFGLEGLQVAGDPDNKELLPCVEEGQPPNYPVWWLGPSFEGLDVTDVIHECDEPSPIEPSRFNSVTYIYGTCEADPESERDSCSPPLQVQSWPACERNLWWYDVGPDEIGIAYVRVDLRGVPGAIFEEGLRVEVYAGEATIVIFGEDADQLLRAVEALVPADDGPNLLPPVGQLPPGGDLPEPARGALEGSMSCVDQT